MVDRINNQRFYDYSKVSQQKRETTEAAEFNLNMGKDGVTYEKSQRKKPEKSQELSPEPEEQKRTAGSHGVKVEISHQGYEKSIREKRKISLMEGVKKYTALAVDFLKSVWDRIWNDHSKTAEGEFPEVLENQISEQEAFSGETGLSLPDSVLPAGEMPGDTSGIKFSNQIAESIYTQEEIRQLFRRRNQQEIEDFLSHHGEKQLARNTELLTRYDRKGMITGPGSQERDLILQGSRNQIKL